MTCAEFSLPSRLVWLVSADNFGFALAAGCSEIASAKQLHLRRQREGFCPLRQSLVKCRES